MIIKLKSYLVLFYVKKVARESRLFLFKIMPKTFGVLINYYYLSYRKNRKT